MPTYDYACRGCGHRFEVFQSIKAEPVRTCPECAEDTVERLISGGSGLLFKGSGFYQTDYRSSSYQADAKADNGGAAAKTDSSPKTGTDTPSCGAGACPACTD